MERSVVWVVRDIATGNLLGVHQHVHDEQAVSCVGADVGKVNVEVRFDPPLRFEEPPG